MNKDGKHDPEMHQVKKGSQWFFGMKAHVEAIRERARWPRSGNRRWRTRRKVYPEVREQNRLKSKIRSRVEHVFAVMKLRFGFTMVRDRGLAKNLHRIEATCVLINLYATCRRCTEVPQPHCA